MEINFRHMEYFLAVVEDGSFSKAAHRLYISQQTLSEVIKGIENTYGLTLFNRTQPISLTYAGKSFAELARKMLLEKNNMESSLALISDSQRGHLSVGFPSEYTNILVPLILPDFQKEFPTVEFTWTIGNTHALEYSLLRGESDFIIGFNGFRSGDIETVQTIEEQTYVIVPKEIMHRCCKDSLEERLKEFSKGADLSFLGKGPYLMLLNNGSRCHFRRMTDRVLETCNIVPDVAYEGPSIVTLLKLAIRGMGMAFVPEFMLPEYTREHGEDTTYLFPVVSPHSGRMIKIAHCKDNAIPEYGTFFMKKTMEVLETLHSQALEFGQK